MTGGRNNEMAPEIVFRGEDREGGVTLRERKVKEVRSISPIREKELHELNLLFKRWSFSLLSVPILWYVLLLLVLLVLMLPLRYNLKLEDKYAHCPHPDSQDIQLRNDNYVAAKADETNKEFLMAFYTQAGRPEFLKKIFNGADLNNDGTLDIIEITYYIKMNIVLHIESAVKNNPIMFAQMDINPKNGLVSWKEYQDFMRKKRDSEIAEVVPDDFVKGLIQRSYVEKAVRDKEAWLAIAQSIDNELSQEDFLTFNHPESSITNHLNMLKEVYTKLDKNGDEILTEDEFSILQEGLDDMLIIRQAQDQRRREFRKDIDVNHDGKADRHELLAFYSPGSPRYSEAEARALLNKADSNHDRLLSFDEMMAEDNLFLQSKMADMTSFHNEF